MNKSENLTLENPAIPTWFEVHFPGKRTNPYFFWSIIGSAGVITLLALWLKTGIRTFLFPFVPLSLGIALIPIATRVGYNILLNWQEQVATFVRVSGEIDLDKWYKSRFREGANSKAPLVCGFLFNILSFIAFIMAGTFNHLAWYYSLVTGVLLLLVNFLCGVVLCSMWFLGKLVWDLGRRFKVHVSRHSYGITSTGPVLAKVYLVAAIVWFIISLSAYRSDYSWLLLVFLTTPTFIFLCGSFIVIQFPLHVRMREFKSNELRKLERVLAKLIPENLEEFSNERREQIEFYHRLEDSISELPEWPFRWGSYAGVIGTSLGAMAPTILSYLLQAGVIRFSWFLFPIRP